MSKLELPTVGEFVRYLYAEGVAIEKIGEGMGITLEQTKRMIRAGGPKWEARLLHQEEPNHDQ